MPKGRGSNKRGKAQGPTPPKNQGEQVSMQQIELMVTKQQLEEAIVAKRQIQAQMEQTLQMAMAILLTKKGRSAKISQAKLNQLPNFRGIGSTEDDEGNLILELIEKEEEDATEGS